MPAVVTGSREIPLAELTTYPGNARRGNLDAIRSSLRRNGQYRPLVVRDTGSELVILAGNNTYAAMKAEGWQSARCEVIECTEDEGRRIVLADNRTADLGSYDDRALAELLAALDEDLDGTGWAADEADEIFRESGWLAEQATSFLDDLADPGPSPGEDPGDAPGAPARAPAAPAASAAGAGDGDAGTAYVQVHWLVTVPQRQTIHRALAEARDRHSLATAADALEAICAAYLASTES